MPTSGLKIVPADISPALRERAFAPFHIPRLHTEWVLTSDHAVLISADRLNRRTIEETGMKVSSVRGLTRIVSPEIADRIAQKMKWYASNMAEAGTLLELHGTDKCDIGLRAGTVLTVDRIYIRRGKPQLDAVTFWAKVPYTKRKLRFWLPLDDANSLPCKPHLP